MLNKKKLGDKNYNKFRLMKLIKIKKNKKKFKINKKSINL